MIDSLDVWKSEFKKLPMGDRVTGMQNFTNFINARVTNKMTLNGSLYSITPLPVFNWNKDAFLAVIINLKNTTSTTIAAMAIANAWLQSTTVSTMVVQAGAMVKNKTTGAPYPGTTGIFTAPPMVVITPSVTVAYNVLLAKLLDADIVIDAGDSVVIDGLREAFSSLFYSVTGFDSSSGVQIPIILPAESSI